MITLATPMRISEPELARVLAAHAWAIEPKADGRRVALAFGADGCRAYTRHGKPCAVSVPDAIRESIPVDTVLDGESLPKKSGVLIFDAPVIAGEHTYSMDLCARRAWLEVHVPRLGPFRLIERLPASAASYGHALERGYEGIVAKRLDKGYPTSTRATPWWLKVKP